MSDERQHGNSQQRETSTHGASALKPAPVDAPDPAPSTPRGMVQDRAGIVGEPIHAHSKHGFAVQGQIRRTRERNLEPGAGRGSVCSPTTPKTATASRGRDRVLSSPSRGSGHPETSRVGPQFACLGTFSSFRARLMTDKMDTLEGDRQLTQRGIVLVSGLDLGRNIGERRRFRGVQHVPAASHLGGVPCLGMPGDQFVHLGAQEGMGCEGEADPIVAAGSCIPRAGARSRGEGDNVT
jgi:hypothetical protein